MKNKFVQALIFVVVTCAVGFMMGTTMAMITNKKNEKPSVLAPPPTTDKTDNKDESKKEEGENKDENKKDDIIVSKPSNFEVTEKTSSTVLLSWGAPENTKGLVGFTILNQDGEVVAELQADATSYLVEGLSTNSIYSFKIKSNYENGESSNGTGVNVRTTT